MRGIAPLGKDTRGRAELGLGVPRHRAALHDHATKEKRI